MTHTAPNTPLDAEQQLIHAMAQGLLDVLATVIPRTTMHYAVTDLQDIYLPTLMRQAGTIKCTPGAAEQFTGSSDGPVTVEHLRAEIEESPHLSDELAERLQALPDTRLREALESAFHAYEAQWYTILDGARTAAITELTRELDATEQPYPGM